jgi:hypothetical protein
VARRRAAAGRWWLRPQIVRVFDIRSTDKALHTMGPGAGWTPSSTDGRVGHSGSVLTLQWMPHSSCVLASGGDDCSLLIWNTLGADASAEGAADVVFVHPGHRHTVVPPPCHQCGERRSYELTEIYIHVASGGVTNGLRFS